MPRVVPAGKGRTDGPQISACFTLDKRIFFVSEQSWTPKLSPIALAVSPQKTPTLGVSHVIFSVSVFQIASSSCISSCLILSVWKYDHTLSVHSSPLAGHGRAGRELHTYSPMLTIGNRQWLLHSFCAHTCCTYGDSRPGLHDTDGNPGLGTFVTLAVGWGRYWHQPGDACAHRGAGIAIICLIFLPALECGRSCQRTPGGCAKPVVGDRRSTSPVTTPRQPLPGFSALPLPGLVLASVQTHPTHTAPTTQEDGHERWKQPPWTVLF